MFQVIHFDYFGAEEFLPTPIFQKEDQKVAPGITVTKKYTKS